MEADEDRDRGEQASVYNIGTLRPYCHIGNTLCGCCQSGKAYARLPLVFGRILKEVRVAQGRSQADVARTVGISPAQLARLEANQRGLYLEDFVRIADALGEKPGNLLPNDLGSIGHLKPVIDRLASVRPEHLPLVVAIIEQVVALTDSFDGNGGKRPKRAPGHR